ncbi:MAG: putative coat protein [Gulmivirus nemorishabitans]|uniref:Coat protein n=1 Tax=Leviviridae sp. TaxID=2027243 RepID=A0ABY3SVE6_9VIRU|nr:MAG: putative coat protein [Leviviridae sp.]
MAIPNPLVITVNAVAKNLPRINQDGYGSEYYLLDTTESYRVKIRHSKESVQKDGSQFDRHNVELTHTVFGTSGNPDVVFQTYAVLRNTSLSTTTAMGHVQGALNGLLTAGFVSDLKGWQN